MSSSASEETATTRVADDELVAGALAAKAVKTTEPLARVARTTKPSKSTCSSLVGAQSGSLPPKNVLKNSQSMVNVSASRKRSPRRSRASSPSNQPCTTPSLSPGVFKRTRCST